MDNFKTSVVWQYSSIEWKAQTPLGTDTADHHSFLCNGDIWHYRAVDSHQRFIMDLVVTLSM